MSPDPQTTSEPTTSAKATPTTTNGKNAPRSKDADLVLSGGGVKGIGLIGAVVALMDAGYRIHRVSGTSAGSIVGAIVAAASGHETMTGSGGQRTRAGTGLRQVPRPRPLGTPAPDRAGNGHAARDRHLPR